jgi:hypothetical protein
VTDEELRKYRLLDCPSCDSHNTNVRSAGGKWYYVGCIDCFNKTLCTEEYIEYLVEKFNTYARRCGKA